MMTRHCSSASKFRRQMRGEGIAGAMVVVGISIILLYAIISGSTGILKAHNHVRIQIQQAKLLDTYYSKARNSEVWKDTRNNATFAQNVALATHLNPAMTVATATTAESDFALFSATAVPPVVIGTDPDNLYLDSETNPVSAGSPKAHWHIRATWRGERANTATVIITVNYIGPASVQAIRPLRASIFKPATRPACVIKTVPIPISAVPHTFNSSMVWDYGIVTCDPGYYRAKININSGCNAQATRTFAFPWDDRSGSCHQISARAGQLAGCGDPQGNCIALCCALD